VRKLLLRLIINAAALYVATELVPDITVEGGWQVLLIVALIFGVINALIRPLLKLLTCPLVILTLGLFTFIINALLLLLTSWVAGQLGVEFYVANFMAAFWGGLVISVVSLVLSMFLSDKDGRKR
jgi:putative membrane protein